MKTALTWHHTATPSGPPQEVIESIRRYHTEEQGWFDVAYHLFIDAEGGLWPGRSLALDPDTHSDLDAGGHIFVAVLGNFEEEHPTKAAVESLRRVIEVLAGLFGIPPSRIQPHGNIAETACPGRYLRTAIPLEIRERLEFRLEIVEELLLHKPILLEEHVWKSPDEEAGYRLALGREADRLLGLLAALDKENADA